MRYFGVAMMLCHIILYPSALSAAEPIKHQITGLFSPERSQDLQKVFNELPEFKLLGVEQATASFKVGLVTAWIDPAKTDRAMLEEALRKK